MNVVEDGAFRGARPCGWKRRDECGKPETNAETRIPEIGVGARRNKKENAPLEVRGWQFRRRNRGRDKMRVASVRASAARAAASAGRR